MRVIHCLYRNTKYKDTEIMLVYCFIFFILKNIKLENICVNLVYHYKTAHLFSAHKYRVAGSAHRYHGSIDQCYLTASFCTSIHLHKF